MLHHKFKKGLVSVSFLDFGNFIGWGHEFTCIDTLKVYMAQLRIMMINFVIKEDIGCFRIGSLLISVSKESTYDDQILLAS